MVVSFTVSRQESPESAINATRAAPGPTLHDEVQAAKEAVTKQVIIIEKLGKFWKVLDVIYSLGDALSDVLDLLLVT